MVDPELWDGRLLSGDEYFDEEIRKNAIRVDGHYAGNEFTERQSGFLPCSMSLTTFLFYIIRLDQPRTC